MRSATSARRRIIPNRRRTKIFSILIRTFLEYPATGSGSDGVSLTGEGTLRGCETVHIIQTDDAGRPGLSFIVRDEKAWTIQDLSESTGRRSGAILPTTADAPSSWCWYWQT